MLNTPFSPWPSFTEEEANAARDVLLSNKVNYWTGQEGREFEKAFAAWADADFAIALSNGTQALDLALKGLGVSEGDEVVVFPSQVLSLASDNENAVESLPDYGDSHGAIVSAVRGMNPDQDYSVDEMADLMREKGTVQARRCRVGKLLNAYLGRELDGKTLVKVNEGRRNFFKLTSGDL